MVSRNAGARGYAKSPSERYPKPFDLLNDMLIQLHDLGDQGAWIHIDVRTGEPLQSELDKAS
jgi:hypothetical protein